jgi:hypothetical protein
MAKRNWKKLTPIRWRTLESLRAERFAELLDTKIGKTAFDESYIQALASHKVELEKTMWKVAIFNFGITIALFLNIAVFPAEFSVLGVKAQNLAKVKELLLFVSSTLIVVTTLMSTNAIVLKRVITVWVNKIYVPDAAQFVILKFGDRIGELYPWPLASSGARHLPMMGVVAGYIVFIIALFLIAIAVLLASVTVNALIIWDAFARPSLPWMWSPLIGGYSILCHTFSVFSVCALFVPLPFRDYQKFNELSALSKTDPVAYRERLRQSLAE